MSQQKTEKKLDPNIIKDIQAKLKDIKPTADNKIVDKEKDRVMAKVAKVRDFQEYFRPYQERRTLMWNELGSVNSYDLPINANAGQPNTPAKYVEHLTLYYSEPSVEQMNTIDELRGASQDMDRQERFANTVPYSEIKKMGMTIPQNYLTLSKEGAEIKRKLLIQQIIALCGIDEETAKSVAAVAHAVSLSDILDSWEYRARTGYPNSQPEKGGTSNTSQSESTSTYS